MFKIKLRSGNFYANKKGRVQHYKTEADARTKIKSLGARGSGARVVHCARKGTRRVTKGKGKGRGRGKGKGKGKGRKGSKKGKRSKRGKRSRTKRTSFADIYGPGFF